MVLLSTTSSSSSSATRRLSALSRACRDLVVRYGFKPSQGKGKERKSPSSPKKQRVPTHLGGHGREIRAREGRGAERHHLCQVHVGRHGEAAGAGVQHLEAGGGVLMEGWVVGVSGSVGEFLGCLGAPSLWPVDRVRTWQLPRKRRRSKRPGRRRDESRRSGRLVAPMTNTSFLRSVSPAAPVWV